MPKSTKLRANTVANENAKKLSDALNANAAARDSAIHSIGIALSDQRASIAFIKDFSEFQIQIAPVAGWTMWYHLEWKARTATWSLDIDKPEPVEFWVAKTKELLNDQLSEILTNISEGILPPPSANENYEFSRKVFAENSAQAKLEMPKMIKAILEHPLFEERIKSLVRGEIHQATMYKAAALKEDKENKIQIALNLAAQQRIRDSERSIIDMDALDPATTALIKHFNFTIEHADELLNELNEIEIGLVPVVANFLNNELTPWVAELTWDSDVMEEAFYDTRPSARACCVHYVSLFGRWHNNLSQINYTQAKSLNVSQNVLEEAAKHAANRIFTSNGFRDDTLSRIYAKAKMLSAGLFTEENNLNNMYASSVEAALKKDALQAALPDSVQLLSNNAANMVAARNIGNQLVNTNFEFSNTQLYAMVGLPAVIVTLCCAATLVKSQADCLKRMGGFMANAINSGITFMSTRAISFRASFGGVNYQPVSTIDTDTKRLRR